MLAKCKFNNIENLVLQALVDLAISHEELVTILKGRDKYEKMNENFKNLSKNMRLNNVNSKKVTIL